VILGAIVLGLGYFLLAVNELSFFFAGLLALVVGNGLFKPNISTLVGKLYEPNDPRLDGAYTIFYMGINIGAFISPFVAQYLRVHISYHAAFAAAGVGMAISLVLFLLCQRWLVYSEHRSDRPHTTAPEVPPAVQRQRHIALLIIFFVVAMFWMAFKQNGNTFNLWARDHTDRQPPAWLQEIMHATYADRLLVDKEGQFSTELFQAVNPLFVIAFSPLLVLLWRRLREQGQEPSTPAKVGLGMVLAAGAFLILVAAGLAGGDIGRVTPWALLSAYAALTLGELCLSPMGLSLVTKLAAPRQRSAWMGGWFAATAIGGYLSGLVGVLWKEWLHSTFFAFLAGTSLAAAGILLVFLKRLKAAMPVESKESAEAAALAAGKEARPAVPSGASS
jgi:POT family proton-dependent oligopeptide transporter